MNSQLFYGLITGAFFGFFLQRSRVVRYDKQIGALRFMDMTILKFMLSSIVVGMVGIYFLRDLGLVQLRFVPTTIAMNVLGGLIFGAGWGVLGYCPGTQGGALGEGRLDALWGILGMTLGAGLYAEFYPAITKNLAGVGDYGFITLPQVLGVKQKKQGALALLFFDHAGRWPGQATIIAAAGHE